MRNTTEQAFIILHTNTTCQLPIYSKAYTDNKAWQTFYSAILINCTIQRNVENGVYR